MGKRGRPSIYSQEVADEIVIYALTCPDTGDVRYVGKTEDPKRRLEQHCRLSNNPKGTPRTNWLRALLGSGKEPGMVILEYCTPATWEEKESMWIARLREEGVLLKNATSGGVGPPRDGRSRRGAGGTPLHEVRRQMARTCNSLVRMGQDGAASRVKEHMARMEAALTELCERMGSEHAAREYVDGELSARYPGRWGHG